MCAVKLYKIYLQEAQLVLASPNLLFRIGHKSGKHYTFFLSSEFERAQWHEAISILQSSGNKNFYFLAMLS